MGEVIAARVQRALLKLRPQSTSYVPERQPSEPQERFLALSCREAAYLGGVGSGKSDAQLRAALQYVHVPGYAALILRRKYKDLILPGAIYDRAITWLRGKDVHHDREAYTFVWPNGARLVFGHMQHEQDRTNYDSSEFQYIGFDEIQHFSLVMYEHMFTRLRGPTHIDVPWRMRVSGMPDSSAVGYWWVRERFVDPGTPDVPCVQATARDNPGIDVGRYDESLSRVSQRKREALREGRWDLVEDGGKFRREWFEIVDGIPSGARQVRAWDRAARPRSEEHPDPDYTAGVKVAHADGVFWIVDVVRDQTTPHGAERLARSTAEIDGRATPIVFAQERGSAGISIIDHYARNVLRGYAVRGIYETGDIELRADPLSAAAELGNVKLVRGPWNQAFIDEACAFPDGAHDDQIAAAALGHWYLSGGAAGTESETAITTAQLRLAARERTRRMF